MTNLNDLPRLCLRNNNGLSSKAVAQASCLFRAFCHGGKDPQTLAQRNCKETPKAFLLGMVIKNYKL